MLVKIEEIHEKALNLSEAISAEVLTEALADSPGFTLVTPGTLSASFKKVSGQVHVTGSFSATVKGPCKRCIKDVTLTLPVEFSLRMVHEKHVDEEDDDEPVDAPSTGQGRRRRQKKEDDEQAMEAGSFEVDAIDAEPFDGKKIDLNPIVREQLLLALPVVVVCRDDCKGLCTTCGEDLNERDCGHAGVKPMDPRLAGLKNIKLTN